MTTLNQYFAKFLDEPFWRDGQMRYRKPSTRRLYENKLRDFLGIYGEFEPGEIDHKDLMGWFENLESRYSEGHLSITRTKMYALFQYCREEGAIQKNPVRYVNRYRSEPEQIVTPDPVELARVYDACQRLSLSDSAILRRDAAIVIFGIAGLRRSNVGGVRVSSTLAAFANPFVDEFGDKMYAIRIKEGKRPMEAVLDESDRTVVERFLEVRPETDHDFMFTSLDPNPNTNRGRYLKPVGQGALIHARRRVCKEAGVGNITFQEMRRHVGSTVAQIDNPDRAAIVLGHSPKSGSRVVLLHYYNPDLAAARKLVGQVKRRLRAKGVAHEAMEKMENQVEKPRPEPRPATDVPLMPANFSLTGDRNIQA